MILKSYVPVLTAVLLSHSWQPLEPPSPAPRLPESGKGILGSVRPEGVELEGFQSQAAGGGTAPGSRRAPEADQGTKYQYRQANLCGLNSVDRDFDENCRAANVPCSDGELPGVLVRVFRRDDSPDAAGGWEPIGTTCRTAIAPGPGQEDLLAAIEREFSRTPLATPRATSQPPGGATLVNLPTYFQLTFPEATDSYGPGQTRSLTLLDTPVQLRIRASHTYDFGDGTRHGPTTSPGGPYPTGDVTHTYRTAGQVTPSATTTYAADYRFADGPWTPLTGSTTRSASFGPLDILTANPVLVENR